MNHGDTISDCLSREPPTSNTRVPFHAVSIAFPEISVHSSQNNLLSCLHIHGKQNHQSKAWPALFAMGFERTSTGSQKSWERATAGQHYLKHPQKTIFLSQLSIIAFSNRLMLEKNNRTVSPLIKYKHYLKICKT